MTTECNFFGQALIRGLQGALEVREVQQNEVFVVDVDEVEVQAETVHHAGVQYAQGSIAIVVDMLPIHNGLNGAALTNIIAVQIARETDVRFHHAGGVGASAFSSAAAEVYS